MSVTFKQKKHCAVTQHNAFNFYSQLPDLNRFLQSRTSCALLADACVTTTVTYKPDSYLRHGWRLRLNFRKKCIAFLGRDTRSRSLILPLVGAHSGIRFYDILSCQEMSAPFLAVNCRLRRPWRHLADGFTILSVFVFNDFFQFFSQLPDLNRVPARYEGAALPGELSWRMWDILYKILCLINQMC